MVRQSCLLSSVHPLIERPESCCARILCTCILCAFVGTQSIVAPAWRFAPSRAAPIIRQTLLRSEVAMQANVLPLHLLPGTGHQVKMKMSRNALMYASCLTWGCARQSYLMKYNNDKFAHAPLWRRDHAGCDMFRVGVALRRQFV